MSRDLGLGSLTLAVAAGYYAMASALPQSGLSDGVGPQGLPEIYAILLAGLSLVLIARSLWRVYKPRPALQAAQEPRVERRVLWRVAGMLLIGVVYVVLVPWLGYVLSLAGLITATTYYQGGLVSRRVVVVAVSGAVFFWLLFVMLLGIPQPPGFWPSLL